MRLTPARRVARELAFGAYAPGGAAPSRRCRTSASSTSGAGRRASGRRSGPSRSPTRRCGCGRAPPRCRACAPRRARPCRARAAASRPGRARTSTGRPSSASTSAGREPASTSQSSISAQRVRVDRLARAAARTPASIASRSSRASSASPRRRRRGRRQQPRGDEPVDGVAIAGQALDVAPPALAPGVDEVERRAAAEPVPVRRAARERAVGNLGQHNRMLPIQPVTTSQCDGAERSVLTRGPRVLGLPPGMSDLMSMTVGELAAHVRGGELRAREVVTASLERIEALDPAAQRVRRGRRRRRARRRRRDRARRRAAVRRRADRDQGQHARSPA